MSKLPKRVKLPTWREVYKGIRKEPNPPGQTFQPKDRDLAEEVDQEEVDHWMAWRGEDFEDFEDE